MGDLLTIRTAVWRVMFTLLVDWLDLTSISLEKSKGYSLDFITNIKHTNKGEAFKS